MASLSDVPFRDTFWNIPAWAQFLLYALSIVAIGVFALGMWQRIALWREGKPEARLDRIPERTRFFIRHGLLQGRILTQRYPGVMHALMFWGFCALLLGTILATIDYDITLRLPLGLDFKLLQGPSTCSTSCRSTCSGCSSWWGWGSPSTAGSSCARPG